MTVARASTIARASVSTLAPVTFEFLRDLERNNHKAWMDEHRNRYRAELVEPLRRLFERLAPAVARLDPEILVTGKSGDNFSRINRDTRFADDKRPYRAQMYVTFPDGSAPEGEWAELYVGVTPEVVTVGLRAYAKRRASRLVRAAGAEAIARGAWLSRLAKKLGRGYQSYWHASEKGAWSKHAGWPRDEAEWAKLRGWVVRRKFSPAAATRARFESQVTGVFEELYPLWLMVTQRAKGGGH